MEQLSPTAYDYDRYYKGMVKYGKPDINEEGLAFGLEHFQLKATDNYRNSTRARSLCDAALLLVRHPDGSTDGVLSHFYSQFGARQGHTELFDKLNISISPEDSVFALLLVTTRKGRLVAEKGFEDLKAAIAKKNNGHEPYVVTADLAAELVDFPSEIVFTQQRVGSGHIQTVEVTNSDYRRIFTYK